MTNENVKHESNEVALAHFLDTTEKKLEGERHWMAAVWTIKDGKVYLENRTTYDFARGDFLGAVGLLGKNLHEEVIDASITSPLNIPPPPLPKANLTAGCPKCQIGDNNNRLYGGSEKSRTFTPFIKKVLKEQQADTPSQPDEKEEENTNESIE